MPESFPTNPEPGGEWQPTEEQRREYEAYLDGWSLPPYDSEELGYDPEALTEEQRHVLNELNQAFRRVFLPEDHETIGEYFGQPKRQLREGNDQERDDADDDQSTS